jgi:tRNA dimethylallyltransferase
MRAVAVVGPTATGKSALALALAETFDGEIVACDSTAVYRGVDIGTDKLAPDQQRGIRHHLVDVADVRETYTAARYATEAAAAVHAIHGRGKLPILAGGTGLYYRALVRGMFPGPARDEALRGRLERVADTRGLAALYRWLARVDPQSAQRILSGDRKRMVRAVEVYLLTGRALTEHFSQTRSPIAGVQMLTIGVTLPRDVLRQRVAQRVDAQFDRGVVSEVERLLDGGLPPTSHALSGLVYRQVLEMLQGVRTEVETRELIVQENVRYSKRQLTWFRKEPNVRWLEGAGETPAVQQQAASIVREFVERSQQCAESDGNT